MRALLKLFLFLPLAGCLAGTSSGRSTTAYVHDDGMHPVQRTTVTQTHSGSTFGASMPMVVAGGGMYGYGGGAMMGVNSGSCVLHPDNCAVIQTAPMAPPMTVVSTGGNGSGGSNVGPGGAGTYGPTDTSDLEARIARLETAVPKLAGGGILSIKQSCYAILKDPGMVPEGDRETIVSGCRKVLKSNPTTEEK